jgi:hypothetical protein
MTQPATDLDWRSLHVERRLADAIARARHWLELHGAVRDADLEEIMRLGGERYALLQIARDEDRREKEETGW